MALPAGEGREAPSWEADPVAWCFWYLRENGHIYRAFRDAADELFVKHPTARTSAETVLQHLRYLTPATAEGDPFKVNNNARSLFLRLYLVERPERMDQFQRRHSFLDDLPRDVKWSLVHAARGEPEDHDVSREWIVTSSDQVAHLLPAGWDDEHATADVRAACGATFKRRGIITSHRRHPHATIKCYRCTRAEREAVSRTETTT